MRSTLPFLLLAAWGTGPAMAQIPVRDFARESAVEMVKISPNGDYVAVVKNLDRREAVDFVRLSDSVVTGTLELEKFEVVDDFGWAGPRRIVASTGRDTSFFERPQRTGELVGIDVDGKRRNYLFGMRGTVLTSSRITFYNTLMYSWASLVDPLPRDPNWALIRVTSFGKDVAYHDLYRLDKYSGIRRRELVAPAEHIEYYLTDTLGRVRYAAGVDPPTYRWRAYVRNLETDTWSPLAQDDRKDAELYPMTFSERENAVYFGSDELGGGRMCLIRQDVATGRRSALASDEKQSLAATLDSADRSTPIAALFEAGRPDIRVLVPESPEGKVLRKLIATYPDLTFDNLSYTLDGSRMVFRAFSDRDPGAFYLVDVPDGTPKLLFAQRPWIKPEQMAERRPLSFTARDGRVIHGFLTLPPGREPKNLPLVVHPHGGPFYVRDNWEWNADSQLLASRGYAVLQVNFRGSFGYGNEHIDAGKKNWVGIVDDITDGLRYAIREGYADPQRVCIYGASFGGYAALMSAVREPDAYQCAITFAGVYDMRGFMARSDIGDTQHGLDYMAEFIGATRERQREQSPSTYIDRLKAPVMIVHGTDDRRVPFHQARLLRNDLEDRNHPYEWLTRSREGHGFYKEDNRVDFDEQLLAFLDRYIGAPGAAKAEP